MRRLQYLIGAWIVLTMTTPVFGQTPVTIRATDPTTGRSVNVGDETNQAIRIRCIVGCGTGGGTSFVDLALPTLGSESFTLGGGVFNDTPPSNLTVGQGGMFRITKQRALHINLRDSNGTEITSWSLAAGSEIVGKFGIDQTTPGTTNKVTLGADVVAVTLATAPALVAGSAIIGKVGIDQTTPGTTNRVAIGSEAAAAENMSNFTAPPVLSANMCWDGATWDRCAASDGGSGAASANTTRTIAATDSPEVTSLALIDDAQTGDSVNYHTSNATTEDETEIKATAGRLFSVLITNTNAAARYFRCYNLTAANTTPGTSTVFIGAAIPGNTAGAGFAMPFGPNGIAFSTALTCTLTTGAADTDVAEVAANEIKWIVSYK